MKPFIISIVLCLLCRTAFAGGPEIEIPKVHVEEVTFDHRGVVLRVTGTVRLVGPLIPLKGESRFAAERLEELSEEPKSK